jgi:26S proteasome regulatory subunit N9
MVMDVDTIPDHLQEQRDAAPDELQYYFLQFEDYWERKLWHELTDSLIAYFEEPASVSQRLPLYNVFIKSFADKINKLKLVTLGLSAAPQSKGEHGIARFFGSS